MDGRKRLPDAELSVMQAVWAHGGEVSRGDIEGALASHGWSVNTINTYLTRLADKGFLSARRLGRSNRYTPLVSREDYLSFDSRSVLYDLNGSEAVELGRFDWAVNTYTPGCVVLSGSDDPDSPYTLIDLASGESIGVQRYDTDYRFGNVAVLTTDNILKVYDGTTGALLTDVEAAPVEEAQYISVTALPDGYALLQYDDENYNTIAIQTYGGEGLLWSSAGEAQQYTYASYLTSTARGPLLTACRDSRDGSSLYDVLDMEGNLLFRRLGSCYSIDGLPDDCFIARQGFDYGLMDSTGQWLYRESIFSSPSDDAGGGYLY